MKAMQSMKILQYADIVCTLQCNHIAILRTARYHDFYFSSENSRLSGSRGDVRTCLHSSISSLSECARLFFFVRKIAYFYFQKSAGFRRQFWE